MKIASTTDHDTIWSILEPIFRAGETYCVPRDVSRADGLAYWAGGNHTAFVTDDGLGTYFICANQSGGGAHVCNCGFATSPAAQGKGVARAMLAHAQDTARDMGFRAMQFNFVIASNTRAVATWVRDEFEIIGTLPAAFNHPTQGYVDVHVMYKTL